MSEFTFDVSEEAWEEKIVAVKEFTDREDPQEAFERKVRILHENRKNAYYVLCYYGIGGIGKTSFINKLCRLIRGVEGNHLRLLDKIDCDYIRYDFDAKNSGTDKLSILLSFRNQLGTLNKDFKFYRFDSALLLYAKKTGGNLEADETAQSLLESNPWLDTIVTTVGVLPTVGWIASALQLFDKAAHAVKETLKKHIDESKYCAHLQEIDQLEPPELLKEMHRYFVADMRHNMLNETKKPLIVFLDTYEKYIDTLNREISMITEDHWLRKGHQTSVIRSIPGILWVVTGREKLYWGEDDRWDEIKAERPLSDMSDTEKEELAKTHLEQHLLGDLSLKDATSFLKKARITNDALCKQLYDLTSGTPLFLDICVDSYHQMCQSGVAPNISDFGKDLNQLISRYLSSMSESNREMSYFLACLGKWNNESVTQIAESATKLRWYTNAKYEAFVKHSFIIRDERGYYNMHETVRRAVEKNADREIWEEICLLKLKNAKENVEKNIALDLGVALTDYVNILTNNDYPYDVYYENISFIEEQFERLARDGKYDFLSTLAQKIYRKIQRIYPGTGLEYIFCAEYCDALQLDGFAVDAWIIARSIPLDGNYDVNEVHICRIEHILGNVCISNGWYDDSIEIYKKVIEKRTRLLGPHHPETISSMDKLAVSYNYNEETKKALIMQEEVYELRKEIWGINHPETINSMYNLAIYLKNANEIQKALEMSKVVYELGKENLGPDHMRTTKYKRFHEICQVTLEKQELLEKRKQEYECVKEQLGTKHPDTISSMSSLVALYGDIGEIKNALKLAEEGFESAAESLGLEHPYTVMFKDYINSYHRKLVKQQLIERRKQAYICAKENLGVLHPDTIDAMWMLSAAYAQADDLDKSTAILNKIIVLTCKNLHVNSDLL